MSCSTLGAQAQHHKATDCVFRITSRNAHLRCRIRDVRRACICVPFEVATNSTRRWVATNSTRRWIAQPRKRTERFVQRMGNMIFRVRAMDLTNKILINFQMAAPIVVWTGRLTVVKITMQCKTIQKLLSSVVCKTW